MKYLQNCLLGQTNSRKHEVSAKKHQARILRKSVDEQVMVTLIMTNIDSINEAKVTTKNGGLYG